MRSYRVTRTEALSFGCTGLLLLLAAQLPAMRHLGYPLAVVTTAPAFVFGVITASNALPAWRAAGLAWLLYTLGVEPIWGCDTLGGLTWTLLGPITGAALGLGVGRTLRYRLAGVVALRRSDRRSHRAGSHRPRLATLRPTSGHGPGPDHRLHPRTDLR